MPTDRDSISSPEKKSRFAGPKFLLAACLAAAAMFHAPPVLAHNDGGSWPAHDMRTIACEGAFVNGKGIVKAYTPRYATAWSGRSTDTVFWNPILYRYNGKQYVQWTGVGSWDAYAYVTQYGLNPDAKPGWRSTATGAQMSFLSFKDLPTGSYKVLNQLHWVSTGKTHSEWGPNACTIK